MATTSETPTQTPVPPAPPPVPPAPTTPVPPATGRELTPEERAALDWLADLSDEAKAAFIISAKQRISPAGKGEVKIGASEPGQIPPSGEIDPVTGAPVKPAPVGAPNNPPPPLGPPPMNPAPPPPTTASRAAPPKR